jgi:hypothetical protein
VFESRDGFVPDIWAENVKQEVLNTRKTRRNLPEAAFPWEKRMRKTCRAVRISFIARMGCISCPPYEWTADKPGEQLRFEPDIFGRDRRFIGAIHLSSDEKALTTPSRTSRETHGFSAGLSISPPSCPIRNPILIWSQRL